MRQLSHSAVVAHHPHGNTPVPYLAHYCLVKLFSESTWDELGRKMKLTHGRCWHPSGGCRKLTAVETKTARQPSCHWHATDSGHFVNQTQCSNLSLGGFVRPKSRKVIRPLLSSTTVALASLSAASNWLKRRALTVCGWWWSGAPPVFGSPTSMTGELQGQLAC